ncbi:unnamed protein product [Clavelina lepadiformis]|uniref:Thioredoxin domain-containing protein n=1 Tax=Clavelina lepadiformis TaxID=159417 RepID=A0ABP0GF47_CLALP
MNQIRKLLFVIVILTTAKTGSSRKNQVVHLTEENWRDCLTGQWMIKFYAPWCPACKANEAEYEEFAGWSDDLNIKVAVVDITREPGLSGRFMVTALPTFYHAKEGEFRRYNNARSSDAMYEYIHSDGWKTQDPVWWLRHPDSIIMTLMSWLFRTSVIMKNVHETLTETYGLSTWLSYALFGLATLITGLTLGIILVCVVEFIVPTKKKQVQIISNSDDKKSNNVQSSESVLNNAQQKVNDPCNHSNSESGDLRQRNIMKTKEDVTKISG